MLRKSAQQPTTRNTGWTWVQLAVLLAITLSVLGLLSGSPEARASTPDSIPEAPEGLNATAVHAGIVDIGWDQVNGAESYEVQVMPSNAWILLPAQGIEIAFYGPGAIVRNLPYEGRYYFSVRIRNELGVSEWSSFLWVPATEGGNRWDEVPEPVNVRATGRPNINGTPTEGETLTVDLSGISDENGLDRVTYHYQWVSSGRNGQHRHPGRR